MNPTHLAIPVTCSRVISNKLLAFAYISSLHFWGLGLTFGSHGHIHPLYHIRLCFYLLLSQTAAYGMPAEGKAGREKESHQTDPPQSKQVEHPLREPHGTLSLLLTMLPVAAELTTFAGLQYV